MTFLALNLQSEFHNCLQISDEKQKWRPSLKWGAKMPPLALPLAQNNFLQANGLDSPSKSLKTVSV